MQTLEIDGYFNWLKFCWVPKHKISYRILGATNTETLICAHSSTTNSHEFDYLAEELSIKYRVILFDFVGRGDSSWFPLKKHYHYYVYIKDSVVLLKKLACTKVHWLGTSMGGVVGMILAACFPKKILSLVLNDIGPEIPKKFLGKMKQYIDLNLKFNNFQQVIDYGKIAYSRLGICKEEDWRYFSEHIVRKDNNTSFYNLKYDPLITNDIKNSNKSDKISLWFWWRRVKCPVLLIAGSESEVLLENTIAQMRQHKCRFEEYKIFGAGHFPILFAKEHINRVLQWIDSQKSCKTLDL